MMDTSLFTIIPAKDLLQLVSTSLIPTLFPNNMKSYLFRHGGQSGLMEYNKLYKYLRRRISSALFY